MASTSYKFNEYLLSLEELKASIPTYESSSEEIGKFLCDMGVFLKRERGFKRASVEYIIVPDPYSVADYKLCCILCDANGDTTYPIYHRRKDANGKEINIFHEALSNALARGTTEDQTRAKIATMCKELATKIADAGLVDGGDFVAMLEAQAKRLASNAITSQG